MTSIVNQAAFLKTSRNFPQDPHQLSVEINKTYVDIANSVNTRTIGLFPTSKPAINGEEWFVSGNQKQQGLRQVYPFTGPTSLAIPHGIKLADIDRFVRMYGTFTDGTFWYSLPFVSVVDVKAQVSFYVDGANIQIYSGSSAPPVVSGTFVLEWLGKP